MGSRGKQEGKEGEERSSGYRKERREREEGREGKEVRGGIRVMSIAVLCFRRGASFHGQ